MSLTKSGGDPSDQTGSIVTGLLNFGISLEVINKWLKPLNKSVSLPPGKQGGEREQRQPVAVGNNEALDPTRLNRLEKDLDLLGGWGEDAADESLGFYLRLSFCKIATNPAASEEFNTLAEEVAGRMGHWRMIRLHEAEQSKLFATFGHVADIPGRGDENRVLDTEWKAYEAAEAKLVDVDPTQSYQASDLADRRKTYAEAAQKLCSAYENIDNGNDTKTYYKNAFDNFKRANDLVIRAAQKTPPRTPEIVSLQRQLAKQVGNIRGDSKAALGHLMEAVETARKIVTLRDQPADQNAVSFQTGWGKAEASIRYVKQLGPATLGEHAKEFEEAYDQLTKELEQPTPDYQKCSGLVAQLNKMADPVLNSLTIELRTKISALPNVEVGDGLDKNCRAQQARTLIDGTDPVVLSRLGPSEQCDLVEHLDTPPIPEFKGKVWPRRKSLHKLYGAMSLESDFMKEDDKKRTEMIEALKNNKQTLKDARDNWAVMTSEQKLATMKLLAEQQCATFGMPFPAGGLVETADTGSHGKFSPGNKNNPQPHIQIDIEAPVFQDFEASLDLIFHENGHNYQDSLVRAFEKPESGWLTDLYDPPYTQARMFALADRNECYVIGNEDYGVYKKQPVEDHAWLIGPQSARMLLDMLNED